MNTKHRCKLNPNPNPANYPLCPLAYELCHSPCDLMQAIKPGEFFEISIETPEGRYENGDLIKPTKYAST